MTRILTKFEFNSYIAKYDMDLKLFNLYHFFKSLLSTFPINLKDYARFATTIDEDVFGAGGSNQKSNQRTLF